MSEGPFVLDTNIFIEAHRRYYGLDLCPGFWEPLRHFAQRGRVVSTLVTHERHDPDVERRVPLGNVCHQLDVPVTDTFEMLRELGVRFGWERS